MDVIIYPCPKCDAGLAHIDGLMQERRNSSVIAQVMACYLTASSYYLNQYWQVFRGIQPRAISQVLMNLVRNICLEITLFKIITVYPMCQSAKYWCLKAPKTLTFQLNSTKHCYLVRLPGVGNSLNKFSKQRVILEYPYDFLSGNQSAWKLKEQQK